VSERDSLLLAATIAHLVVAALAALAFTVELPAIGGVHPAQKPFKFAISIAILLGTLAYLLPVIPLGSSTRSAFAWLFVSVMIIEMTIIITQALRGVPSHFNVATPLDARLFNVMAIAIALSSVALVGLAVVATIRPLAVEPMLALAIRIGLLLVLLVAVSGFAMGGRLQHSVGGPDGGAGLPLATWSSDHGDLRVSHFFALHGMQVLPLAALVLVRTPVPPVGKWLAFGVVAVGWCALAVGTLVQALAGRPFRVW
jgi:hypothetical protein